MFTHQQMEIVRFCGIECELQRSGEQSVAWMLDAWAYASTLRPGIVTEEIVQAIAVRVEPVVNANGYRTVDVRVGSDVMAAWEVVPVLMESLVGCVDRLTPEQWFKEYEEVHPFRDGNGRSGQILYQLLRGTLDTPDWAPDFWEDSRRYAGFGAPSA
jgi:hypothetical protein